MKKKTIALLLGMAMLFAAFAPGVFAEEANTSTPAPTETPVETATPPETTETAEPTVAPTTTPSGDATATPTTQPTTEPTATPVVAPTETPVVCTCDGTEEEKAAEGFIHKEGCPLYVAPEAEPAAPAITEREIIQGAVTVSGLIPEGVTLHVTDLNANQNLRTMALAPETRQAEAEIALAKLDITLYNPDGTEWQPEKGETVRVTLDAEALGLPEGLIYSVRHIHENEDGTSTEELLGPYVVSEGKAVFELTSFSYVIIIKVGGEPKTIEKVQSFYTVSGNAVNNHIKASGVYFTQEGNAHLLLTSSHQNHATNCQATTVTIDKTPVESLGSTAHYGPVSEFKLQNGENEADVTDLLVDTGYNYVIDIDLGKITLTETFTLSVTWNNGTIGGFAINGMQVQVVFNDGISKEVYSVNGEEDATPLGQATPVKAGDVIIYKIVVKNGSDSTQSVTGSVADTLPDGIFEIYYSADSIPTDNNWTKATVDSNRQFTLAESITLNKGEQKTYYVKATVKSDAAVDSYENKATFNNREATATVQVTAPPVADLTITKQGCEDIDENQSFLFDVTGPENYSVRVVVHGNGSATIKDLPLGEYTVTEDTGWSWRYTPELEQRSKTVTLSAEGSNTVGFTNKRSASYWLNGCAWCDNRWKDYNAIHDNDN